MIVSCTASLLH